MGRGFFLWHHYFSGVAAPPPEQVAVESDGMSLLRIFNDLARFFFLMRVLESLEAQGREVDNAWDEIRIGVDVSFHVQRQILEW